MPPFGSGSLVTLRGDRRLYGVVGEWLPGRGRWVVALSSGVQAAAAEEQLEPVRLEPGAFVTVQIPQLEFPLAEVVEYLSERGRWVVRLEGGQEAAAREDQLLLVAPAGATDVHLRASSPSPSGCCEGGAEPRQECCKDKAAEHSGGHDEQSCAAYSSACKGFADSQVWDGLLNDDAKALVELVARKGAGDWEGKLEELRARLGLRLEAKSAEDLRICWDEAAPLVKAKLSERPSMPCGHTCGTCPTRSDCHLEGLLDMEDFGSGAGERQRAAAGKGTLSRRPEGSPPSANL